jgi:hypothetical protein
MAEAEVTSGEIAEDGCTGIREDPPVGTPRERRRVALLVAHELAPAAVALPVAIGIVTTLWRLRSVRYPYLGWAQTVANDAKAIALGHWIYGDPADQYTGMLYTPLYPVVVGGLYRVFWWDGWPVLVTIFAGIATATMVGVVAGGGTPHDASLRERVMHRLGGFGVAGVAWWLVSTNYRSLLFDARADQLAWCLAIAGLLVLARAVSLGRKGLLLSAVLLSAALWTKQTTIGAMGAALVVSTWWMVRGVATRRSWLRFVGAVIAINCALLAVFGAMSKGWLGYFILTMPGRHSRSSAVAPFLDELKDLLTLPAAIVGVAFLGVLPRIRRSGWPRPRAAAAGLWRELRRAASWKTPQTVRPVPPFALALGALVLVFLVLTLPPAFTGRRKQGGEANQYIGLLWGLGVVLAIVHRQARRRTLGLFAGLASYVLVVCCVHVGPLRDVVESRTRTLPTTYPAQNFISIPFPLRAYARDHEVYTPFDSDLSTEFTGDSWPMQQNIVDLLAADVQPKYLIDAFIDQRFDAVQVFDVAADPYASAFGKTEENYLWKLNELIRLGYVEDPATGLLARRTEPVDLGWARSCFGPFELGGTSWEIRRGGGWWCNDGTDVLVLRGTPAPVTEVVTSSDVAMSGTITVRFPNDVGTFEIVASVGSESWTTRIFPIGPQTLQVVSIAPDGSATTTTATPDATGSVIVAVDSPTTPEGPAIDIDGASARWAIRATPDSQVVLDFANLSAR